MATQARRLRELEQKYFNQAMTGDDVNSTAIW
jgi:hypothetical protein